MECRPVSTREMDEALVQDRVGLQLDEPLTHILKFEWPQKQVDEMLIRLQRENRTMFDQLCEVGASLDKAVSTDDGAQFMRLVNDHQDAVFFLRYYLEESFISAVALKQSDLIEFMLVNGLDLKQPKLEDCVYSLVESSKYTPDDPPVETLLLLLRYNAPINYLHTTKYKNALHQAVKYGIIQFVELLLQNGGDPNAVDRKKRVAMNMITEEKAKQGVYQEIKRLLQKHSAHSHWRQ